MKELSLWTKFLVSVSPLAVAGVWAVVAGVASLAGIIFAVVAVGAARGS